MATVQLGRNAAVGIGFETTEGTAVAAALWARLASLSLTVVSTRSRIDDLSLGDLSYLKARYLESVEVSGSMEILCYYEGGALTSFLRACIGGTWATTGSGPYTHTLSPGAEPPAVTFRTARDTLSSSGALQRGDVIAGARVTSATLSVQTPGIARLSINFVAMSSTPGAAPTPSLSDHTTPVLSHAANRWQWNSVDYTPRSISLDLENAVEGLRAFGSASITGSAVTGVRNARMTVTRYKDSDNWPDAQTAGTESDGDITFTSGTDQFRINLYNAQIPEAVTIAAQSVGLIEESAIFEARDDGTDPPVEFVVVNDDASAEAS
jgi:hypothetical protein